MFFSEWGGKLVLWKIQFNQNVCIDVAAGMSPFIPKLQYQSLLTSAATEST